MNRPRWIAAVAFASIWTAGLQAQTVLYVDDSAPAGGDGLTWDTAMLSLQDAIELAAATPTVEVINVAQGIYFPDRGLSYTPGDRTASFNMVDDVVFAGGFAGFGAGDPNERDIDIFETVLSGEIGDPGTVVDNSYHVITSTGNSPTAILDGFTVQGGAANGPSGTVAEQGGGLLVEGGGVLIRHCRFRDNWAHMYGGGACVLEGSAAFVDCEFIENRAEIHSSFSSGFGGGLYAVSSDVSLTRSRFLANNSIDGGTACFSFGGSLRMMDCVIQDNTANRNGAGVAQIMGELRVVDTAFTRNISRSSAGALIGETCLLIVEGSTFEGNEGGGGDGATLALSSADASFSNCRFINNSGTGQGGGIQAQNTSLGVESCEFESNSAGVGGAIYTYRGDFRISSCVFADNHSSGGGAIFSYDADERSFIVDSVFLRNSAALGGAVYFSTGSPSLINSFFGGNHATENGGGCYVLGRPTLIGNSFNFNRAEEFGGALYVRETSLGTVVSLLNSTFHANLAIGSGAGIYMQRFNNGTLLTRVRNCVFWANRDPSGFSESAQLGQERATHLGQDVGAYTLDYSIVQGLSGWLGGAGNLGLQPIFSDPIGPDGLRGTADDDLSLAPGSPGIDAGSNALLPPDFYDLDHDGDVNELFPLDQRGNARRQDDRDTFDSGQGSAPIVDMGAYEFQGTVCPADFNGDGAVDSLDFLAFLNAFAARDPAADFNDDGAVDTLDFLSFLNSFVSGCG